MKFVATALLPLSLAACAVSPQPPPAAPPVLSRVEGPPPVVGPAAAQVHAIVTANRDAAQILQGLGARGLRPMPSDVSRVDLLAGSPGYAWRLGQDSLFLHAFADPPSASASAQRFVATAMARSRIIDWAGTPRLFQCRTALALYLGDSPQALNVLTYLCGPPLWTR